MDKSTIISLVSLLVWPSVALAYPGGAVVSTGSNPVQSFGGTVSNGATDVIMSASVGQDFVITDVHISPDTSDAACRVIASIVLSLAGSGDQVGQYIIAWETDLNSYTFNMPSSVDTHLNSGIKVPAGETLNMAVSTRYSAYCSSWAMAYTIAGYHAQP